MIGELSIVRGWPETVETLREWRRRPVGVIVPWLLVGLVVALALLTLVWLVGSNTTPAPESPSVLPGDPNQDVGAQRLRLLRNNLTVLALHALACFAGYIVHRALTEPSDGGRLDQWTRSLAIVAVVFVPFATLLSIATQAWVLGSHLSTLAEHLHVPVGSLLASTLGHSVVELTAVFLPLAAWLVVRVRGDGSQLLAATLVACAFAVPMLIAAADVEARSWGEKVRALQTRHPHVEGADLGELAEQPAYTNSSTLLLRAGDEIVDRSFASPELARAAASAASRDGKALVVVRVVDGYRVNELLGKRDPNACERPNQGGVPPGKDVPVDLRQLRDHGYHVEDRAGLTSTVDSIVQGSLVRPATSFLRTGERSYDDCGQLQHSDG